MIDQASFDLGGISLSHSHDALNLAESHSHDTYELIFISEGSLDIKAENFSCTAEQGSVILLRPLYHHAVLLSENSSPAFSVLHFSRNALPERARAILDSSLPLYEIGVSYSPGCVPRELSDLIARFSEAKDLPQKEAAAYAEATLSQLIVKLSASVGTRIPSEDKELASAVMRFISDNITEDLSLDVLSRRFFVSKYYLCRAFKKKNGVSIHIYITQKRIMYARQLIESGETASSVAYKVGFGDYSAFYRAYQKYTGGSPTSK